MEPIPSNYTYELGENGRSISVTGTSDLGQEVRLFMEWNTAELMDKNLSKSLSSIEKAIANFAPQDQNVAGDAAPGASSNIKRFNLPFGRKLSYSHFKNHEYDEAALVLGPIKFVVQLTAAGTLRWKTLTVKKREPKENITLGIGGARSAWFIALS